MISIRKYISTDLEALTDLMNDLGYPTDTQSMKNRMESIESNPDYYTFMAEVENEIAGMVGARIVHFYEGDGVTAQISALVIKENFQGKGIGKELIRFIESWAREKGAKSLYLTSGAKPERAKAHDFYKRQGFVVNGYRFVKGIGE